MKSLLKRTTVKNRTTLQMKHEKNYLCCMKGVSYMKSKLSCKVYNLSDISLGDDIHT